MSACGNTKRTKLFVLIQSPVHYADAYGNPRETNDLMTLELNTYCYQKFSYTNQSSSFRQIKFQVFDKSAVTFTFIQRQLVQPSPVYRYLKWISKSSSIICIYCVIPYFTSSRATSRPCIFLNHSSPSRDASPNQSPSNSI